MALLPIDMSSLPEGVEEKLAAILTELHGLTRTVVAGAADATNINIAGIDPTADTLKSVTRFHTGVPSDVTSEAAITSAGHIQLSTTDTTGDVLIVEWYNRA